MRTAFIIIALATLPACHIKRWTSAPEAEPALPGAWSYDMGFADNLNDRRYRRVPKMRSSDANYTRGFRDGAKVPDIEIIFAR